MTTIDTPPRVVAIIQARMGSSRLPGKSLADLEGRPLLARVIERVRAAKTISSIVLATTTDAGDQALIDLARAEGADGYAGSVDDVLDRFYQAARQARADVIVRITADDPFKDPDVIDAIVHRVLDDSRVDYASNTITPTFPEGIDIEVFTFAALQRAWQEAQLGSEREHVTPYIWKHPDRFTLVNVTHQADLSHLRWTIDYEQDLQFAREVYRRLGARGVFTMGDILALLEREPALGEINTGIVRNAGYAKSLAADQASAGGPSGA